MKSNLPESPRGQTLRRRIDTIIALLFLTFLVGSLIVVVNLLHHSTSHAASPSSRLVPTLSVYVGNGTGGLEKLDASTGRQIWTFQTGGKEVPAPALIANNTAYFGSDDGNLYAVNPANGAKLWSKYTGTGGEAVSVGTPAVVNGVVYATSTNNSTRSYVLALKAQTGAQIWHQQANNELYSSPQVGGGRIYVAATAISQPGQSTTRESHLEVFNAANGTHTLQLGRTQFATASTQSISPPTLANGSIYSGTLGGSVSAVNASSKVVKWGG